MSIYEKFGHQFDAAYQIKSVRRVDAFIDDTKLLLKIINESCKPTTHLQILTFSKVAQRILQWRVGDLSALMFLLWHVVAEVSKSVPISYPQDRFPHGAGKNMPTLLNLIAELSLESYCSFMKASPIESSVLARNLWPLVASNLTNTRTIRKFAEFLANGAMNDSIYVVNKSLQYLTAKDQCMKTIIVFLSTKTGRSSESVWNESKRDVLNFYKQLMNRGKISNESLAPFCFGEIPEGREFTHFSCMAFRRWRPPGESYLALYNTMRQEYSSMIHLEFVSYNSTDYVSPESEFGYFLDRIIMDFQVNSYQLNKSCLELLVSMVQHHLKTGSKPLVHIIKQLQEMSENLEIPLYRQSKGLDQFKLFLRFQALGECLTQSILAHSVLPYEHNSYDSKQMTKSKWYKKMTTKNFLLRLG